jgi:sodium/potassium-transporting ATPase subunit alpha
MQLVFAWGWGTDGYAGLSVGEQTHHLQVAQSVFFVTLVTCQLGNLLSLQTRKIPFGALIEGKRQWPVLGRHTVAAIIAEPAMVLFLLYVPFFNQVFGTAPVPGIHWLVAMAFGVAIFFVAELRKWCCVCYPEGWIARHSW